MQHQKQRTKRPAQSVNERLPEINFKCDLRFYGNGQTDRMVSIECTDNADSITLSHDIIPLFIKKLENYYKQISSIN